MKKLSKRFIISVLTLVLTVVALGTSTFAWFSLSTVSSVSNIGGGVTAGDSLLIQLEGVNSSDETKKTAWMANINANAFLDLIKVSGFEFTAVTTEDGTSNFKKMATSNGKLHLGASAVVNQDYLEFKVNFKSQAAGSVYLTGLEFGGAEGGFEPDSAPYIQVPGESSTATKHPVTTKAAYGARVSFSTGATPTNTVYQMGNDTYNPVLGFDDETPPTKVQGNHIMAGTASIAAGQWSYLTEGLGLEIYANESATTPLAATAGTLAEAKTDITTAVTEITLAQVDNEGDYLGSVVVRIWIEGWDVDSYDSIYELLLNVDLTFEKKAPVVNP